MVKEFRLNLVKKAPFNPYDPENTISKCPALMRLQRDLEEMHPLPPNVQVIYPVDDCDLYTIHIIIKAADGFYAGGCFKFCATFKKSYPLDPPKVKCLNPPFHPNIDPNGAVCLNILRLDWNPVLSLSAVIFGLILLIDEPITEDPLYQEAASILEADPKRFAKLARESVLLNN